MKVKITRSLSGPKKYWSILNSFLGKKKMPIIPPLLDNGELVTDYQCKADIFNNYFASQCMPLDNFDGVHNSVFLLSKSCKKKF